METTDRILRDTGLDKKRFEDLTPEEIDMLGEQMGFEIKARLTKFFAGLDAHSLKEHFNIIDESVKDIRRQWRRERKDK